MQSDIVQRLQPILRRNGWGNVQEYSRHIPFMLEREGLCIVETAEITRLTEALRAAEERAGLLRAGLERIAHRDPWTDPDSPERIARDTLAGAKP